MTEGMKMKNGGQKKVCMRYEHGADGMMDGVEDKDGGRKLRGRPSWDRENTRLEYGEGMEEKKKRRGLQKKQLGSGQEGQMMRGGENKKNKGERRV